MREDKAGAPGPLFLSWPEHEDTVWGHSVLKPDLHGRQGLGLQCLHEQGQGLGLRTLDA